MICADHFEDECINRFKSKGKVELSLKPNSVPTKNPNNKVDADEIEMENGETASTSSELAQNLGIPPSQIVPPTSKKGKKSSKMAAVISHDLSDLTNITSALENFTISDIPSPSSTTSHVPLTAETVTTTGDQNCCMDCRMKDELLENKDAQIKDLRKRLKKMQQKSWHSVKVKEKLNSTLLELKTQSVMNEEQLKVLKVFFSIFFSNFLSHLGRLGNELYYERFTAFKFCPAWTKFLSLDHTNRTRINIQKINKMWTENPENPSRVQKKISHSENLFICTLLKKCRA